MICLKDSKKSPPSSERDFKICVNIDNLRYLRANATAVASSFALTQCHLLELELQNIAPELKREVE
jgi:hypothetical protein